MGKKQRIDGIIVGVHLKPEGKVDWARVFLRRGSIFSDRTHISRLSLIEQIKQGKNFMIGERVEYLAGTFKTYQPVNIAQKDGEDILVSSQVDLSAESFSSLRDFLVDVAII